MPNALAVLPAEESSQVSSEVEANQPLNCQLDKIAGVF